MKKLIALMLLTVGMNFMSCSKNETLDLNNPNDIKKKFDFSEVDTSNLQGIHIEDRFNLPELTVVSGALGDCLWVGLFDTESGSLKCQYTDVDHPTSYFAYGEEYKYGVGYICQIYFENNHVVFVIRYSDPQYDNIGRFDLIDVDGDKQYRHVIDEKSANGSSIMKWTNGSIYITLGDKGIIYDVDNNVILSRAIGTSGRIENDIYHNRIISPTNELHFWNVELFNRLGPDLGTKSRFETHGEDLVIDECQCTYDNITNATKYMFVFSPDTGDSSEPPRYSTEYKTRTDDHIVFVATQTEYDGTITTKTVDIRVENDELIVDIQ